MRKKDGSSGDIAGGGVSGADVHQPPAPAGSDRHHLQCLLSRSQEEESTHPHAWLPTSQASVVFYLCFAVVADATFHPQAFHKNVLTPQLLLHDYMNITDTFVFGAEYTKHRFLSFRREKSIQQSRFSLLHSACFTL